MLRRSAHRHESVTLPDDGGESITGGARKEIARRAFLRRLGGVALGATVASASGFVYASEGEAEWLEVTRFDLGLPHLPPQFGNYKMVHISDLHLDDRLGPAYLHEIVRRVNAENPDLIAVTGDFVTFSARRFAPRLASIFASLEASDGVLAVLGNHDHLAGPEVVRKALRRAGVETLGNAFRSLEREGHYLHLCGIDDIWEGRPDLERVLDRLPEDGAAVLLVHEPDFADTAARTGRFDLQLSGHSHGGQVRLPLVGAPVLPRYAEKYPIGLYEVGGVRLYTNRGLGMLPPRLRFLCRPEVTVFTLKPERT